MPESTNLILINGLFVEQLTFKENSDYVYTKNLLGEGVEYITVDGVNISNPTNGSHCVAPNDCWEIIYATRHLIAYGRLAGSSASFTVYPENATARSPIGVQYKRADTPSYSTLAEGVKPVFAKELLNNETLIHILLFNTDIGNISVSGYISTKGRFSDVITLMGKTGVQKKDLVLFTGHLGTVNRTMVLVYPENTTARSPIGVQYKRADTPSYSTLAEGVKPVFAKELLKNETLIHILLFNTDIGNISVSGYISTKGRFSDVITLMGKTGVQKKDLVLFTGHLGTENRTMVIGTPTYGLAKWLFRRLKFLTAESDTTVSSSAEFLEKLKGDLAIETIELPLQSKYDETENRLGRAQVLQLLKFCLWTYFTFDGTIYEQVKGTPMGSPISGFIPEAVLQRLVSLVFQHHKPTFWARYVDDTFVVIDRDQLLTFKECLNAVFPDIQFTMEEEENNQLAFLDVLICRKDCGGLKTKVFRKSTNTMQVLNFNSNHPISHQRSCVRTLFRRVETHCSEPEDKIAELQYLRRVFKANGYQSNFVNRCIRKMDEKPNRRDTKVWRALPHVKNVSEAVGRLLAPLGVGVAHRPEPTIRRQLMKPKEPLPRQETSGVVYRIWCSCGQSNYVGETERQLRTRMAEHAAAVRRNDAGSQVAAHSTGSGHTFKFDEAEILARGDNRVSRELLES
nr:unnamed protein product [Spirometra erinaceieuropaei]